MRGITLFTFVSVTLAALATYSPAGEPPSATPPPCAADGTCYPKRGTWGYYERKWRQWPTDSRPEIPGRDDVPVPQELPEGLQPIERPRPEIEDRRAPESLEERRQRAAAQAAPADLGPPPERQGGAEDGVDRDLPPRPPLNRPLGPPPLQGPAGGPDPNRFNTPPGDPLGNLDHPPKLPAQLAQYISGASAATSIMTGLKVDHQVLKVDHQVKQPNGIRTDSEDNTVQQALYLQPLAPKR